MVDQAEHDLDVAIAVAASAPSGDRRPLLDELTPRELEVLALLARGLSNADIAASLHLVRRRSRGT